MHVHAQAQDEYERRLKEEMDAKLQKEREIEQLVSRVGLAQPAVMQGWCLLGRGTVSRPHHLDSERCCCASSFQYPLQCLVAACLTATLACPSCVSRRHNLSWS